MLPVAAACALTARGSSSATIASIRTVARLTRFDMKHSSDDRGPAACGSDDKENRRQQYTRGRSTPRSLFRELGRAPLFAALSRQSCYTSPFPNLFGYICTW